MLKFSVTSAFRRKLVSILAIIGVGLGSGLLVTLLALSAGTQGRFNRTFQRLSGTIAITAKGGSVLGRLFGTTSLPLPSPYIEEVRTSRCAREPCPAESGIRKVVGVETVAPYVSAPVHSDKLGPFGSIGVGLTGVIEGEDLFDSPNQKIAEGRPFTGENEVIAGQELFEFAKLSGAKTKVGDKFIVPVGATKDTIELTLVGVFKTGTPTNDRGLFGPTPVVRKLAGLPEGKISGIMVRVSKPSQVKEIASSIEALFADRDPAVTATVASDIFEGFRSFLDIFNLFLLAIALVAAAAGGTAVMVVMLLTVFERRREFGILKAAGWSNFDLVSSVIVTSLTLSILGVALGLSVGTAAALIIQAVSKIELVAFSFQMFAWAAGMGVVTGLVGGIIPAISAALVSPIETLRGE